MIAPARVPLVLTLACASFVACQSSSPTADSPPKPAAEPTTAAPVEALVEPEPVRVPNIFYYVGSQIWRVDADASGRQALGFEVAPEPPALGGAVGTGESSPTISPNGRWLAYANDVDLFVVELSSPNPTPRPITTMPAKKDDWIVAAEISYSTWSPDSSTLVVMLREPGYEEDDPLPLPAGLSYGAQVLRTSDLALVHAPHIEGFYGWTPDSKGVIDSKYIAADDYQLLVYPIDPGPARILRTTTTDGYGFMQLQVTGGWFAWNSSIDGAQIVALPFADAGGEPKPLSPKAAFADIQWPMVAPDGARALFRWKGKLHLGVGPDAATAKPAPVTGWPRWFDAEHLLAVTSEGLVLMDLDGVAKVLDPAGTGLIRQ